MRHTDDVQLSEIDSLKKQITFRDEFLEVCSSVWWPCQLRVSGICMSAICCCNGSTGMVAFEAKDCFGNLPTVLFIF